MRTNTNITFDSAGTTLAGTMTKPDGEGAAPAALILAGSGPLDRDGNIKRLPLGVSRDLADLLADAGWASLRFDKRGIGESGGDYHSTGFHDELADAEAALAWLMTQPGIGPIVVIGHSVGAIYAGEMASRHPDLAGVVLLATSTKTGLETLEWQGQKLEAVVPAPAKFVMKLFRTSLQKQQAKNLRKLQATTTDVARIQMVKINAKWMREFMAHDPKPALEHAKVPLLAITGEKDIQVDAADLDQMLKLVPEAQVHSIPDLDHILRYEPADISNPRKYKKQIENPIDQRVTDSVLAFLESLAG